MKSFIHPSFWGDPDIEAQTSDVKLVALWLITNSKTCCLGVCETSAARFSFESGLPQEALQRAIEALPKMFKRVGKSIFITNFIRHQFGSGESLMKNNFFRTMTSIFLGMEKEIQDSILQEYPEFTEARRASEGLSKPKDRKGKVRKGKVVLEKPELFEKFWDGVPSKLGRGEAIEAWAKAITIADPETIVSALPTYLAYEEGRRSKPDYSPLHPATWLNKQRWTDVLPSAPKAPRNAAADKADALLGKVRDKGGFMEWFQSQGYARDIAGPEDAPEEILREFLKS